MGVLRGRAGLRHGGTQGLFGPREGTFEAHQPSSWSSSAASSYGAFYVNSRLAAPRTRPPSAVELGRISSEAVGVHTGVRPATRERPASVMTVQLKNPAVRDGRVSSEAVGWHAGADGWRPRTTVNPAERTCLPGHAGPANRPRTCRPQTAPLSGRGGGGGLRSSDSIGSHPPRTPIDQRDAAAVHYEAQFSKRFGESGHSLGAVLAGADTASAVAFQQAWVQRAESMRPVHKKDTTATDNTSKRADGALMEKMDFDAVYSSKHVNKDTESAIGPGFVPIVDPRCITRPASLPYGVLHKVPTAGGVERAMLPSRSFMRIGTGPGRAIDF